MSEEKMIEEVHAALIKRGVEDDVLAVGEFNPRGHTGGLFAGGLAGGSVGDQIGGLGGSIGVAAGSIAGMKGADELSGLPGYMLIGVTASTVYGFAGRRSKEPTELVFETPREGLEAKVHQRVNVRVLELIHADSGSTIELEGNRLPITHTKDVIDELTS